MPSIPQSFAADSPWWKGVEWIHKDADLERLAAAPLRFEHSIPFNLEVDAVYTLRGPRQVGKSTLLKRIIKALLLRQKVPPRCILYADIEGTGITSVVRLRNAINNYVAWVRTSYPDQRIYLFLDEITGVPNWGVTIRTLFHQGALTNATVLATGSHALDLARGGETAPGRRGEHQVDHPDWIMMPLTFRDYVAAHAPELIPALPAIDVFDAAQAHEAAQEIVLHQDPLRALFERYLLTGGYPHAMSAEYATDTISPGIYSVYLTAMTGQMKRAGHHEGRLRELVAWAANGHLGREFSWNTIAQETEVGTKDTTRTYMEDAERLFLWHILHRAKTATTTAPAFKSPKKLYLADPFSWHTLASWVRGDRDPWGASIARLANPTIRGEFVESVAGDHFIRVFGRFALYYRASHGQEEIDLVLHRQAKQARIEIKYRGRTTAGDTRYLEKYGGGVLATIDTLDFDRPARVARIPLYALLAGYAEPATLYPAPR